MAVYQAWCIKHGNRPLDPLGFRLPKLASLFASDRPRGKIWVSGTGWRFPG